MNQRVSTPFVIAGLLIAFVFGVIWTKHHRAARAAEPTADDMMNDINNAGVARKKEIQKRYLDEQRERVKAAGGPRERSVPLPDDLDEPAIRAALERCNFFREPVSVTLPAEFHANLYDWTAKQYPALPTAIREHLVELNPPFDPQGDSGNQTITVSVPSLTVTTSGTEQQLDLGFRRVDTITPRRARPSSVTVEFSWTVQASNAVDLLGEARNADATIDRVGGRWIAHYRGQTCE